jgi:ankyrin repeat protein
MDALTLSVFDPSCSKDQCLAMLVGKDVTHVFPDGTCLLFRACVAGLETLVLCLIEKGANPNQQSAVDGTAPLHGCCVCGDIQLVKILAKHGASTSLRNFGGASATCLAIERGDVAICTFLLEAHSWRTINDVNPKTGASLLLLACQSKHTALVRLLLEHGASTETVLVDSSNTALHVAVFHSHTDICKGHFQNSQKTIVLFL